MHGHRRAVVFWLYQTLRLLAMSPLTYQVVQYILV